jgi:hypothetical protein
MLRVTTVALLLLATGAPATAQDRLAHPAVDLRGALYRAVFVSATDALSAGDVAALPAGVRTRVSQFLTRRRSLERAGEGTPPDPRALLKHSIVALVDREDARALAADFLREAPVAADWGDSAAAPLEEASYAEKRLRLDAPLAPFLYVFIAQRQRAAFELADRAQDLDTMKAAAKKYRVVMQRARSATDLIYGLLADDLDRVPFVYANTDKHPATFNPDT